MKLLQIMLVALVASFALQAQAAEFSDSGNIGLFDGDGDTFADDLSYGELSFTVATAGTVSITSEASFDGYLVVFDTSDNSVVYQNDDDPLKGFFNEDAGLEEFFAAGSYKAVLGVISGDTVGNALQGYIADRPFTGAGDWSMNIVTPVAVPLPAALPMFISALLGLGLMRRKS